MRQLLIVPGPLPGMNAFAGKGSRWNYTKLKKVWGLNTGIAIGRCKPKLVPMPYAHLHCMWYEPDNMRDPDNITVGLKFVLDALVGRGILVNDGRKEVLSIYHDFITDQDHPRLELWMDTKDA